MTVGRGRSQKIGSSLLKISGSMDLPRAWYWWAPVGADILVVVEVLKLLNVEGCWYEIRFVWNCVSSDDG